MVYLLLVVATLALVLFLLGAFSGVNKQVDGILYDASGNQASVDAINGRLNVQLINSNGTFDGVGCNFLTAGGNNQSIMPAGLFVFNGTNFDRTRGNVESTLLTSAARTTTQTTGDQVAHNAVGVLLSVDMTAVGTGSITPSLQLKDPVSGAYVTVWTAGAAITANGTNEYVIYPGVASLASFKEAIQNRVSRTFRWTITANNANAATYSVGQTLLF